MFKKLITLFLVLFFVSNVFAWCSGTDCNTDWLYKQELTLNTEGVLTSDVTNEHAILVHVDSSNTDFWENVGNADANDVRFTDSTDAIDLNYHFELVDTDTNDLWAWVRVPSFDADANTVINMYYGNPNVVDNQNEAGTYPDGYLAVYHMNSLLDSTSNNNDFTQQSDNTLTTTDCAVGYCYDFASGGYLWQNGGTGPIEDASSDNYSISLWFNADVYDNAGRIIYGEAAGSSSRNSQIGFDTDSTPAGLLYRNGNGANQSYGQFSMNALTKYNLIGTYNTSTGTKAYQNYFTTDTDTYYALDRASYLGAVVANTPYSPTSNLNPFDGTIDEIKVFNYTLSDDEASLIYHSEDNNLITFGTQEVSIGVTAVFSYNLNQTTNILQLIDTSTDTNVTINDWNWLVNNSTNGLNNANAQNPTFSGVISGTDYNISLCAGGLGDDGNIYTDCTSQTISFGSGLGQFNFYDENSLAELTGVSYTISPSINGLSSGTLTDNNLDLNLVGITAQTHLFTFSKTGYGTRYYQTDLNQFSELDINFGMLPNELGRNIEFQIYDESEVLYPNQFVEFYNWDSATYAGKRKTNSEGKATFFINPNDANYTLSSNDFDYNAMTLTVNKPKDEITATEIDGNWKMDVGGLAWQSYTDITGNQAIQIYANTSADYELAIADDNSDYFERKYYVNYIGGTTAETLQPYLVPTSEAVSTTIFTISAFTQQPVGDITIQIYKTIEGAGRVLVEQVVTDDKGEALVSLIANDSYEFEIYRNSTLQGTLNIVATSSSIYINISDLTVNQGQLNSGFVNVLFNPNRGRLIGTDTSLTQTISVIDKNSGLEFTSARIIVTNTDINGVFGNDVNIYDETITILTNSIDINSTTQTLNGVNYDTNGHLIVSVIVTTNQGTQTFTYTYKPMSGFDVYKAIGYDLRPFFGCTSTTSPLIPCAPMLGIAIFISLIITIGFVIETGFTGQNSIAGVFLVIMGIFTYFAWVPIGIMAIMTVGYIMISLALGGKQV